MNDSNVAQANQTSYSAKSALRFLKKHPQTIIFPIFGLLIWLILSSTIVMTTLAFMPKIKFALGNYPLVSIIPLALAYIVAFVFIPMFINATMFKYVLHNMQNNKCSIITAIGQTGKNIPALLGWTLISGSIGVIFKGIEGGHRTSRRIFQNILGFSWGICSYLIMPIMIGQNVGPIKAFKQSYKWGRNRTTRYIMGDLTLLLCNTIIIIATVGLAALLIQVPFLQNHINTAIAHYTHDASNSVYIPPNILSILTSIIIALGVMLIFNSTISCVIKSTVYLNLENNQDDMKVVKVPTYNITKA